MRGKVFFFSLSSSFCVFYFAGQWSKDPVLAAISTHTPGRHTLLSFTHAGHFIHMQITWEGMSCFCGACRSIFLHCSLSTTSWFSLHIPPSLACHLFDFRPLLVVISSRSCCQSTPLRLLSAPLFCLLLLPMLEVVDGWITLEPKEAVPLIVKRGTIGPLVWLGPQIVNSRDKNVQTAEVRE